MREVIVRAIWNWLHDSHLVDEGTPDEYTRKNAHLYGVNSEERVGIDDEINLVELAAAIEKAIKDCPTIGQKDLEGIAWG